MSTASPRTDHRGVPCLGFRVRSETLRVVFGGSLSGRWKLGAVGSFAEDVQGRLRTLSVLSLQCFIGSLSLNSSFSSIF